MGLEIRSVNSRFLDLAFRLPDELRPWSRRCANLLTAKLKRGKVEVRAAMESASAGQLPEPVARLLQRLSSLQDNVRRAGCPMPAPERGRSDAPGQRHEPATDRLGEPTWPALAKAPS
jgi:uncharacterized protein YicC (UPF0701 family)